MWCVELKQKYVEKLIHTSLFSVKFVVMGTVKATCIWEAVVPVDKIVKYTESCCI